MVVRLTRSSGLKLSSFSEVCELGQWLLFPWRAALLYTCLIVTLESQNFPPWNLGEVLKQNRCAERTGPDLVQTRRSCPRSGLDRRFRSEAFKPELDWTRTGLPAFLEEACFRGLCHELCYEIRRLKVLTVVSRFMCSLPQKVYWWLFRPLARTFVCGPLNSLLLFELF